MDVSSASTTPQLTDRWRVLMLTRYTNLGASSRLRLIQYRTHLEKSGAEVVVSPLFDDSYLTNLYASGRRRLFDVLPAYLRRLQTLLTVGQYSVVWVQKELFPFLPSIFEGLLARMRVPYVVDFDDAIFHTYDQHRSSLVRWILGQKLAPLILRARSVVVGNGYLESYVRGHGAHKVVRIPTVVDIQHYRVVDEPPAQEIRIGWIGTPETAHYLYIVRAALRSLGSERAIRLVTIGAPPLEDFGVPMEQHPWTENTESEVLQGIHIGIMPLPDQAWERGKCAYKLIQYMACGRPVIASPVGVNRDIVTNDVGILASTSIEWTEAFRVLASDPIRRRACGAAARRLIEREYSLEATAPRLVRLLQAAGS